MAHPTASLVPYVPSEVMKGVRWPEENFSATIDDHAGYYPLQLGETFEEDRFVVTRKLGWGTNSSVWLARDRKEDQHVALKVLTAYATRDVEEGKLKEREILKLVTTAAPSHRGFIHVLHLLDEFKCGSIIGDHICFVTDVLSYSFSDFKANVSRRLTVEYAAKITTDVLKGLEYLHNECNIVHTDLQPANLILKPTDTDAIVRYDLIEDPCTMYKTVNPINPFEVPFNTFMSQPLVPSWLSDNDDDEDDDDDCTTTMKAYVWVIVDFSDSHVADRPLKGIVQPYALRAPEVLLGLEWGPPIDIWSLGCLMFEFLADNWLFDPKDGEGFDRMFDHLGQISVVTGRSYNKELLDSMHDGEGNPLGDFVRRAIEKNAEFGSLESRAAQFGVDLNDGNTAGFIKLMRSFLYLSTRNRPSASKALEDPILKLAASIV